MRTLAPILALAAVLAIATPPGRAGDAPAPVRGVGIGEAVPRFEAVVGSVADGKIVGSLISDVGLTGSWWKAIVDLALALPHVLDLSAASSHRRGPRDLYRSVGSRRWRGCAR